MITEQAQEIVNFYKEWTRKLATGMTFPTTRRVFNEWGDLTAEPDDVAFSDLNIAGIESVLATPEGTEDVKKVLLCCHGGGFVTGSPESHRKMYGHIAKAVGCKAVIFDYSLAPKNAHPGIISEAVSVYAGLLALGYKPEHIATTGDSAGGTICTALVLYAVQLGYPMPAACVPLSPWFDMECTEMTNGENDELVTKELLMFMAGLHLGGKSPRGPLANPLHADLKGFPPTLIQVGGYETLVDDGRRFYEKAKKAGVDIELQVFPEMQHVFQMMAGNAPEADAAVAKIAQWLRPKLGIA